MEECDTEQALSNTTRCDMRKLTFGLRLDEMGSGSQILPLILYQDTLKNFVYATDENGNAILVNQGSGEDGLLNTGRALELSPTNDLPISVPTGSYMTLYDFDRGEHVMYNDTGTEVTPL